MDDWERLGEEWERQVCLFFGNFGDEGGNL